MITTEATTEQPTLVERLHLDRRESRLWLATALVLLVLLWAGFHAIDATRGLTPMSAAAEAQADVDQGFQRLKRVAGVAPASEAPVAEPQEIEIVPEGYKMYDVCGLGRMVAKKPGVDSGPTSLVEREDQLLAEPLRKLSQHSDPRVRAASMLYAPPTVALLTQAQESGDAALMASVHLACAQQSRVPSGQREQVRQWCDSADPAAWAQVEPDNGQAWRPVLDAAFRRGDEAAIEHALRQIAKTTKFETHEAALHAALQRRPDASNTAQPLADLLMTRAYLLTSERRRDNIWQVCRPRQSDNVSATRAALCAEVAGRLIESADTAVDRYAARTYLKSKDLHTALPSLAQKVLWIDSIQHLREQSPELIAADEGMREQPHSCESQRMAAKIFREISVLGEWKHMEAMALRRYGSHDMVLAQAAKSMAAGSAHDQLALR